jgi:hypothetical protein
MKKIDGLNNLNSLQGIMQCEEQYSLPFQQQQKLDMVVWTTCDPSYAGDVSRSIGVQTGPQQKFNNLPQK